jgi:hypothetical protein
MTKPLKVTEAWEAIGRAICTETCANRGEPPCHSLQGQWPPPACGEPGCKALAQAVVASFPPIDPDPRNITLITSVYLGRKKLAVESKIDRTRSPPGAGVIADIDLRLQEMGYAVCKHLQAEAQNDKG